MTDWQRIEALFHRVAELPADEATALLDRECTDPDERTQVESLLAAHHAADRFLEAVALERWVAAIGDLPAGTRIGAYRIVALLGRGGMGAVYLADAPHGQVALKIADDVAVADAELRLQRERELLARLSHPNIARWLDGGTTETGNAYFVMEYVDGVPLDRYCQQRALGLAARVELVRSVAAAVAHAHAHHILHRDLKPANILVTRDGTTKLLDFGIAKLRDPDDSVVSVTTLGRRALTPAYASPEQLAGAAVTTACDVYALGVVLYELVAGEPPFAGTTLAELLASIAGTTPPPASGRGSLGEDAELDAVIATALRKDPATRQRSMVQLRDELTAWLAWSKLSRSASDE